eukprot:scaffold137921_cov118-Phaeocystis_antarctica.AAC.1
MCDAMRGAAFRRDSASVGASSMISWWVPTRQEGARPAVPPAVPPDPLIYDDSKLASRRFRDQLPPCNP